MKVKQDSSNKQYQCSNDDDGGGVEIVFWRIHTIKYSLLCREEKIEKFSK